MQDPPLMGVVDGPRISATRRAAWCGEARKLSRTLSRLGPSTSFMEK